MERWFAPSAWLGGPSLVSNVEVDVARGAVEAVRVDADGRDATHCNGILLPGFVSAHSHSFHRALRGKTHSSGGDFWTWRMQMYRLAQRLNPDSYRRLAAAVFSEMLRAGITTVGEFHYLHHHPDGTPYADPNAMAEALVTAAADTGIRLTLLDSCYLVSSVDGAPPHTEQRRFADADINAWRERVLRAAARFQSPRVQVGVAAHSVRAVPAADLPVISTTATDIAGPIHVHVSEQVAENAACLAAHGITPTRLLADAGMLGGDTTAIHATHLTADDMDVLAASATNVCVCPTTELDLGDGFGPFHELAAAGVDLSVGSDSNAVIDLFEEARAVEYNDRARLQRRGVHPPETLMAAATTGGLRSLGWGDHTPLAPGSPADFVVIDPAAESLAGFEHRDGIAGVLFSGTPHAISRVVVGGETVVSNREVTAGHNASELAAVISELAQ